jgi:tetratricopeptide (TPR) repeat protein
LRLKLAALGVLLGIVPVAAQSKKYPPVPPDKDLEEERRSDLWESTLNPDMQPYNELVRDATRLLATNTADNIAAALEKLDAAIKRLPGRADAYRIRGQAHLQQREWVKCADDLGRAVDYTKQVDDPLAHANLRVDLANCQARAGRYADAETTLVRTSASLMPKRGEVFMRLGEVRIALGKLDEAIDALTVALDANDSANDLTRWLLAVAHDRARRPSEALEHAQNAKRYDQSLSQIQAPRLPLLGAGDTDYFYGVAFRYALPKPEYALLHFRRFQKVAPDSPWRRRADEHIRELSAMKFPARDTITHTGTAAVAVDDVRKSLERPVATMRQCVAKLPMSAFQVAVTKVGPRTPETTRDRPIYRLPAPGTKVTNLMNVEPAPPVEIENAQRCLDMQAAKLSLPAPKERDTYYTLSFVVVAP